VVSDRGMVTKANLELLRETDGASWITALKAPQVKRLVKDGELQLSLFDQHNLAEVASDDFPDDRLVVCRNPLVAQDRARKREELLQATERALGEIAGRVERGTLRGEAEIGLAVGAVWNRWRVRKHFELEITDASLRFERKREQIEAEAALDGIYVLRTSASREALEAPDVVRAYKQLKEVERGFRELKGPLELRPIHHRLEDRVKAHVFLCMLTYYLAWHLRRALSSRCSSTTSSRRRAPTPSPRPPAPGPPSARRRPSAPPPASPATPFRRCSGSSQPDPATRSACPPPAPPSTSSPSRRRPRPARLS
jgi:Transposase DDE domain